VAHTRTIYSLPAGHLHFVPELFCVSYLWWDYFSPRQLPPNVVVATTTFPLYHLLPVGIILPTKYSASPLYFLWSERIIQSALLLVEREVTADLAKTDANNFDDLWEQIVQRVCQMFMSYLEWSFLKSLLRRSKLKTIPDCQCRWFPLTVSRWSVATRVLT